MANNKEPKATALKTKFRDLSDYLRAGVWKETRNTVGIRTIKVLNLSVRSFLDRDLQTRSMSLTYSTVLATVPAFALLFAIGRGFGFQNLLEDQLYSSFPAQKQVIEFALSFVDSYLKEASQGIFVGVGIVFLLWTLISLLSHIESAFNTIWDVRHNRAFYKKVTDYTAICLLVPVLMICSSGVSIFMSSTVQDYIHSTFLTPFVNAALGASPLLLAWLAFTLSFFLIPNTKVGFKYAAVSGAICAVFFQLLQMLFVSGQIYVSKYNAIYGSFAFLPLLLIWLQLSWLILLSGCVLAYSLQNVLGFNFIGNMKKMSLKYERKISIILAAAVAARFRDNLPPPTVTQLSQRYDIPIRVVSNVCDRLQKAGLVNFVMLSDDRVGVAPAMETDALSVGLLLRKLDALGDSCSIPRFSLACREILDKIDLWLDDSYASLDDKLLAEISLPEAPDL